MDMSEIDWRTAPNPQVLWIELTSRCPFDCVFCTRKSLRGAGEHLAFAVLERLLAALDRPRIIRLNYAGESGHYPRLADAVALAKATGASIELVSALASLKPERLRAALTAGLDRLTVSLHTRDPDRYAQLYRFASLAALDQRLDEVIAWRDQTPGFVLDLAFVAMPENLGDLIDVARAAAARGIGVLALHPLIARDPLPLGPSAAHLEGRLTAPFIAALRTTLAHVRAAVPTVSIEVSSHELDPPCTALADGAQPWPWPLPDDVEIEGCDQSPFDTIHVLADGRVVACEVTEKHALGNLHTHALTDIWRGAAYRAFRSAHRRGHAPACRECVYKRVQRARPAQSWLRPADGAAQQWLSGWHPAEGALRWGQAHARFWLVRTPAQRVLTLRGVLAEPASLVVDIDGMVVWSGRLTSPVALTLPLPVSSASRTQISVRCATARSPAAAGRGADLRELGFGLIEATLE
jgi:MoaA/NifB/PqqE/SkfB family radical SAM enzyme